MEKKKTQTTLLKLSGCLACGILCNVAHNCHWLNDICKSNVQFVMQSKGISAYFLEEYVLPQSNL